MTPRRVGYRAVGTAAAVAALVAPVVAGAPAVAQEAVRYVAVGDSFAAGAGMRPVQAVPGSEPCSRYEHNYPTRVAEIQGWDGVDVTCSGAGIQNAWDSAQNPPTVPSQKEAIAADTDVVTFQFGGNDSRVSVAFKNCLIARIGMQAWEGPSCEEVNASAPMNDRIDFRRLTDRIPRVLQEIRERAPHARVVVVGYPAVLPEDSRDCIYTQPYPGAPGVGPMRVADLDWFRGQFLQLNSTLEAIASDAGVEYADTYTPFIGHDACQPDRPEMNTKWIAGVLAPESGDWDHEPLWAAAHPNRNGHEMLARQLANITAD